MSELLKFALEVGVLVVGIAGAYYGATSRLRVLEAWHETHERETRVWRSDVLDRVNQMQRKDVMEAILREINHRLEKIEQAVNGLAK